MGSEPLKNWHFFVPRFFRALFSCQKILLTSRNLNYALLFILNFFPNFQISSNVDVFQYQIAWQVIIVTKKRDGLWFLFVHLFIWHARFWSDAYLKVCFDFKMRQKIEFHHTVSFWVKSPKGFFFDPPWGKNYSNDVSSIGHLNLSFIQFSNGNGNDKDLRNFSQYKCYSINRISLISSNELKEHLKSL